MTSVTGFVVVAGVALRTVRTLRCHLFKVPYLKVTPDSQHPASPGQGPHRNVHHGSARPSPFRLPCHTHATQTFGRSAMRAWRHLWAGSPLRWNSLRGLLSEAVCRVGTRAPTQAPRHSSELLPLPGPTRAAPPPAQVSWKRPPWDVLLPRALGTPLSWLSWHFPCAHHGAPARAGLAWPEGPGPAVSLGGGYHPGSVVLPEDGPAYGQQDPVPLQAPLGLAVLQGSLDQGCGVDASPPVLAPG